MDEQQGLQPISQIAAAVMTEMISQRTNENLSSKPPQPQPSKCPTCDGFGRYIGVYTAEDGTVTEHHVTCDCEAGRAITASRNKRLLELSDLPERCRAWTFAGYNALALSEDQQIASKMVEEFANTGQFKGHLGVYLHGSVGLGKSGLAAAAVNWATKAGNSVLYMTVPNLLDHLRATYAPTAEVQYDKLMDRIKSAQLLVLDDMGTEKTSQWAVEKLFQIIDHRSTSGKRLIVTSNLSPDDLLMRLEDAGDWTGQRIMDRIMQICASVRLDGNNLRGS